METDTGKAMETDSHAQLVGRRELEELQVLPPPKVRRYDGSCGGDLASDSCSVAAVAVTVITVYHQ